MGVIVFQSFLDRGVFSNSLSLRPLADTDAAAMMAAPFGLALSQSASRPDPVGDPGERPTIVADERVVLPNGGARFAAKDKSVEVIGGDGDDVIKALSPKGNLVDLSAGGYNRVLIGPGDDVVIGSPRTDVVLARRGGDNWIDLSRCGNNRVFAGSGDDTILGGIGDDVFRSGRGDDYVKGGAGDDVIINLRGNSTLIGGDGNDLIRGGIGDAVIEGGPGDDRLFGGPGRDTFVFREGFEVDRILDFNPRADLLDFSQHGGVSDLDDLTIRRVGANTIIEDGAGGRVVLVGVAPDTLGDGVFVF